MKIPSPSYVEERDGNLYAGESRVTVTSIVSAYTIHRMAPEEIQRNFPTLSLEVIHGVLAYYFGHKKEIDEELARQEAFADQMIQEQRDDPNSMHNIVRRRIEGTHPQEGNLHEVQ